MPQKPPSWPDFLPSSSHMLHYLGEEEEIEYTVQARVSLIMPNSNIHTIYNRFGTSTYQDALNKVREWIDFCIQDGDEVDTIDVKIEPYSLPRLYFHHVTET